MEGGRGGPRVKSDRPREDSNLRCSAVEASARTRHYPMAQTPEMVYQKADMLRLFLPSYFQGETTEHITISISELIYRK